MNNKAGIIETFVDFISNEIFPCVAAKAALSKDHIKIRIADHMACPKDDIEILNFLYDFIETYRKASDNFYSAAIIFKGPEICNEQMFDTLLWQRLQALSDLDAKQNKYDMRVNKDPRSENFSFSLKEEAFFVIGLNPKATRSSRLFPYPTLVFNPHAQFEKLRSENQFDKMKAVVRKRDIAHSGTINPNLTDYGTASEVRQYSGLRHPSEWKCPLRIHHEVK